MSTLRDPVGRKDRKVYVRRRLVVLLVLIAVVGAVALIILKPGGQSAPKDAGQVEVPSDLATTDGDEDEAEAADGKPKACGAGQLEVVPLTDQDDYAEGELPKVSLSVENTGEQPCSADLGTASLIFEISSGSDQVWSSQHCQEDADHRAVLLDPGKPVETEGLEWDRTRSSPETCDISRDPVSAGGASYHLRAKAAGVQGSGTAQFLLF
ncbi:hypothetical protein D3248_03700 [Leucobacter zeae]|nr:hypothetical protein [Leucobacter zeae]